MPRGLDTSMAAALASGSIAPVVLVELTFLSGVTRAWSGIGDLTWSGKTFSGVGSLGAVGPITEASAVQAEGTTLTLAGLSQIIRTPETITPSSPLPNAPAGTTVAFARPRQNRNTGYTTPGSPGIFSPGCPQALSTNTSGSLDFVYSRPLGGNVASVLWSNFALSGNLPADAVISAIYPLITVTSFSQGTGAGYLYYGAGLGLGQVGPGPALFTGGENPAAGGYTGPSLGTSLSALGGLGIEASLNSALDDDAPGCSMSISNPGFAVYYTSVSGVPSPASMLQEALSDAWPGAPAKIWFGLWNSASGTFIGTPYLIFSGVVDEPTIDQDPVAPKIVLALENRLRNLQRASQRRYTAADQKLSYPNDSGFNWVEILQEISLKWGA